MATFTQAFTQRIGIAVLTMALSCHASADLTSEATLDTPCGRPEYQHGISYVVPLKYGADFEHFDYANPAAPKAGRIRYPVMGTFDSFNNLLEKGRIAAGTDYGTTRQIHYERLLEPAADEPASAYGRLAEGVAVAADYRWVAFKLRAAARWHDGEPLTIEDVIFTFEAIREHGSIALKTAFGDLDRIEPMGERELCFVTRDGAEINPILPFAYGGAPIHARHYWQDRDVSKTTLAPPLGAGPYRLAEFDLGRKLTYERVSDYWARDIPVNRGRYNFDRIQFDYFRDEHIMLEAHKADVIDLREETVSKNWATEYEFPAVKAGMFKRDLRYITRVWGLWWPVFWNQDQPRFQDPRIREALYLLYDFPFINRVILFGFYDYGESFFHNSPMAQSGLPTPGELELLEPFRDQLPPRLFTEPFTPPYSTGEGFERSRTERALALFAEAGWEIDAGRLVHVDTGEQFHIDFVFVAATTRRATMPYIHTLNRIGITTTARAPETSHWLHRMRTGTFDAGVYLYIPNHTPGLTLRNRFGSAAADVAYSQNWANIRDPVLDHLIDKAIQADNAEDLYAATRSIDRVLLWRYYFVPSMAQPGYRLVYWDKFGEVETEALSRVPSLDAWWWDAEKAKRIETWLDTADE